MDHVRHEYIGEQYFPLAARAAAVSLPRTSLGIARAFIALLYSQFELIKIIIEKVNYSFFLILRSL
jgi:hypothetical protein